MRQFIFYSLLSILFINTSTATPWNWNLNNFPLENISSSFGRTSPSSAEAMSNERVYQFMQTQPAAVKARFLKLEAMQAIYRMLIQTSSESLDILRGLTLSMNDFIAQNFLEAAQTLKDREVNFSSIANEISRGNLRAVEILRKGAFELIEKDFYNVNFSKIIDQLKKNSDTINQEDFGILSTTLALANYFKDLNKTLSNIYAIESRENYVTVSYSTQQFHIGIEKIFDPALQQGFIPGNCGLDCFKLSRQEFVEILLDYSRNEAKRNLYGYSEILSAVSEGLYALPDSTSQELKEAIENVDSFEKGKNLITEEIFTDYILNFYDLDRLSLIQETVTKKGWLSHTPDPFSNSVLANEKALGMMELLADHFRKNLIIFSHDTAYKPYKLQHV